MYKFSIIIGTFNAEKYLENCLKSILDQLNKEIDLIIIDANSSDNTINIVKKYHKHISYWISEPDQGIYDAWNKGIAVAKGDWIMFLGADDILLPGALSAHHGFFDTHGTDFDIVSSKIDYVNKDLKHIKYIGEPWNWNKFIMSRMSFAHPGMLHNRKLFSRIGPFDMAFKICGDSEFLLRTQGHLKTGFLNAVTVKMQSGGMSHSLRAIRESFRARKKNATLNPLVNSFRFCNIFSRFYISKIRQLFYSKFEIFSSIILPKVIVFSSYPNFTDNSFAVYKYIVNNNIFPEYTFVWIAIGDNVHNPFDHAKNTRVVKKKTIASIFYYLVAKYVFFTHGLYSNIPIISKNKVINLWHGMPLKRIGLMDKYKKPYMKNTQLMVATSPFFQTILSVSFNLPLEKILVLGLPRNDLLFEPTDFYDVLKIDRCNYKSIGIWLPTYRSTVVGDVRSDGDFTDGVISFLDFDKLLRLNEYLVNGNNLLIVKLHPMDRLNDSDFNKFSNLIIIKQKNFNFQLYPLLGATDYLLTDYSSVWVDYDVLGKPIGFLVDDVEKYKNARGFTIPNILENLPGKLITDIESLFKFISDPDKYRVNTGSQFNSYKDSKSCKRLLDSIIH